MVSIIELVIEFIFFFVATLLFMWTFTLIHELGHGLGARIFRIPFKIYFDTHHTKIIPFEGSTHINLKEKNWLIIDKKYSLIAFAPYFILFPIFHYMYIQPYTLIKLFGIIGFIWNSINLPLEFVYYAKQRRKKKAEADTQN